jgi:hypothetical protein
MRNDSEAAQKVLKEAQEKASFEHERANHLKDECEKTQARVVSCMFFFKINNAQFLKRRNQWMHTCTKVYYIDWQA